MRSNRIAMSQAISKIRKSAAIAARSALIVAATISTMTVGLFVLNGAFNGRWHADWRLVLELTGAGGLGSFAVLFLYAYFVLRANEPLQAILTQAPSRPVEGKPLLSGFVAMECYGLVLDRTFVVFIAPEGLYGWKAEGGLSTTRGMYFAPYANMLKDDELMRNHEAVSRLSRLKGGFFIPRADISSADVINKQKWGMGLVPHSGRIRIRIASGGSRELILLGSVDAKSIQQRILGTTPEEGIQEAPHALLPYVARYQKKLWVPLFVFFTALSTYFIWDFSGFWKASNWTLRGAALCIIGMPLFLLLEFVVQNVRFTESGIQWKTRLGRIVVYPYSAIRKLSDASDAFIVIELSDGRKLRLYSWQGDPREILAILQAMTKLTVGASA